MFYDVLDLNTNKYFSVHFLSPDSCISSSPFQGAGVADQFVQHVDDLSKLWPVGSLSLPAVQHELVKCHRAVHGWGQPVALINSLDHLDRRQMMKVALSQSLMVILF